MPWKQCLARNLALLIVSIAVTVVAMALTVLLQAGGDATGAAAVRGVVWVGAVISVLSSLAQLVLLSLIELSRPSAPTIRPPDSPPSA